MKITQSQLEGRQAESKEQIGQRLVYISSAFIKGNNDEGLKVIKRCTYEVNQIEMLSKIDLTGLKSV